MTDAIKWHPFEPPAVMKSGLVLILAIALSSCATLQSDSNEKSAASSAAPVSPATREQTGSAGSGNAAPVEIPVQEQTSSEQEPEEINSEGRVIQYSRYVENAPQVEPPGDDIVELNYEQADLRTVIEDLGDQLQINTVIDPSIDDKVSVRTSPDNPLQYDDIWPLLRMLTGNAGVTIEQSGDVYEFKKDASKIPTEIVMPPWLNDATSSEVLQITPLTYISVESALQILTPMIQPEGSIIRLGQANLIGISGTPSQLMRINALLQVIDDDPFQNQGIRLYKLLNSQAADVSQELTNILGLIEGEQSSYHVLGLERINAVLVIAPATRGFNEVSRWIRVLDAESEEQVEQLFFYKVKNLSATSLAETLTNVFETDEDSTGSTSLPAAGTEAADTGAAAGDNTPGTPPAAPADNFAPDGVVSANISVTIVADEDTNSLLVRGTPRDYRQLLTTINNLDTPPPQVLINAVIGQVTLTDSNQFGVDWTRVSQNASTGPARLTSRFLPNGLLGTDGTATQGSGLVFTRSYMNGSAIIDATLNAIAQDNEVKLLARPTILATNNQEGEIKVGQSVPIDTGTTVTNNTTVANISYRDTGIVLTITPHINDDGFINLEIFQSLSSVEEGAAAAGVANNPIFTNQEITTTAVVSDQSTITLGGLIQEDQNSSNNGVPGLRKIPVLGGLFSYQESKAVRRELFIILRPQILNGDERDTVFEQQFRENFEQVSALLDEAGL